MGGYLAIPCISSEKPSTAEDRRGEQTDTCPSQQPDPEMKEAWPCTLHTLQTSISFLT